MDKAIDDGQWQPSNWMDQEYSFMLPDEAAHANTGSGPKVIYILDDFGSVATPFLAPKRVRAAKGLK